MGNKKLLCNKKKCRDDLDAENLHCGHAFLHDEIFDCRKLSICNLSGLKAKCVDFNGK